MAQAHETSQASLTDADRAPALRLLQNWALTRLTPHTRLAVFKIAGVSKELLVKIHFHENAENIATELFDISRQAPFDTCPLLLLANYLLLSGPSDQLDPQDAAYARNLVDRNQKAQNKRSSRRNA
jgi:hypothetical protein